MLVLQRTVFCVFFIIGVAFSKPVKTSSESSESSEASSEEKAESPQEQPEPAEPAEPTIPNAQEEMDPPYSEAPLPDSQSTSPILASHQPSTPSALPDIESESLPSPTVIDIHEPMTPPPDGDPSHNSIGECIREGTPNTDPINTDIAHAGPEVVTWDTHVFTETVTGVVGTSTDVPHVTIATYHLFPPDVATPLPGDAVPTPPPDAATPLPVVAVPTPPPDAVTPIPGVAVPTPPPDTATPILNVAVSTPPPYSHTSPQPMSVLTILADAPVCFSIWTTPSGEQRMTKHGASPVPGFPFCFKIWTAPSETGPLRGDA